MRLLHSQDHRTLLPHLEVAQSFWARSKGLLGRKNLPEDQGLWILRCNSVHTFFMHFAIDLIFLNKNLEVTKTFQGVPPGRLVLPVWRARSVIELSSGFLKKHPLSAGDKLHVDSALS